ncbi:MAG: DNA-binding protein [Mollicutes bacterium]|nr:DNA-binding protein [Mollicutes bacterium]
MEYCKIDNTYIVRIFKDEEITEKIKELCKKENIKLGTITGIGATNDVEIGLYDTDNKKYYTNNLVGMYEITSLLGNITTKDDEPYLHIHITVADLNNYVYGGHLTKCIISATAEIFINVIDGNINRRYDGIIGLNLMEIHNENK